MLGGQRSRYRRPKASCLVGRKAIVEISHDKQRIVFGRTSLQHPSDALICFMPKPTAILLRHLTITRLSPLVSGATNPSTSRALRRPSGCAHTPKRRAHRCRPRRRRQPPVAGIQKRARFSADDPDRSGLTAAYDICGVWND